MESPFGFLLNFGLSSKISSIFGLGKNDEILRLISDLIRVGIKIYI
jgi:hypothetical protein